MGQWTDNAVEVLKELYVETDIPSDTLIKKKEFLLEFTSKLNSKLPDQRDFTSEEAASQLLKIRKKGDLPTIRT